MRRCRMIYQVTACREMEEDRNVNSEELLSTTITIDEDVHSSEPRVKEILHMCVDLSILNKTLEFTDEEGRGAYGNYDSLKEETL